MCEPSTVADDWIVKGFHLHIGRVELALRPDHRGGVVFRPVFSAHARAVVEDAMRTATRECLTDASVRNRWIKSIKRAVLLLLSHDGDLEDLARGRMAEMNFLRIALERYDSKVI
jgi:hypothetical protein